MDGITTPAEAGIGDDAGPPSEPIGDSSGSGTSIVDRLLATEPVIDPANVSGSINPDAPWYGHLAAGLFKMAGTRDLPAIGHVAVAVFLFASDATEGQPDPDGDTMEDIDIDQ